MEAALEEYTVEAIRVVCKSLEGLGLQFLRPLSPGAALEVYTVVCRILEGLGLEFIRPFNSGGSHTGIHS